MNMHEAHHGPGLPASGQPPLSLWPGDAKRRRAQLRRRRALERVVEKAIARLDRMDGDPDLEDGDSDENLAGTGGDFGLGDEREGEYADDEDEGCGEPSLCGVNAQHIPNAGFGEDCELDESDDEPSLSYPEGSQGLSSFRVGGNDDREGDDCGQGDVDDEHDCREPEDEGHNCGATDESEPSLCGVTFGTPSTAGGEHDLEQQCEDEGADTGDYELDADAEPDTDGEPDTDAEPDPYSAGFL